MVTLHYDVTITKDGKTFTQSSSSEYEHAFIAEDIMHSMECGVFNENGMVYAVKKIVYELELVGILIDEEEGVE